MSCKEMRKYLDAYVDGELEAGTLLEVDRHLESCAGCSSLVLLQRRLKSELAGLGRSRAPERLRRRVEALSSRRDRIRLAAGVAALPLAAAAALLLVFTVRGSGGTEAALADYVQDVVERHVRQLPMEVEGPDAASAASWFQGKVDFPVRPPALPLKEASFEGARLSNVREHPAAHMSYSVDGHRVTVMIFNRHATSINGGRRVQVAGRDVLLGERNGFNVVVVLDGDLAYALSSDLPKDRLLALVREL